MLSWAKSQSELTCEHVPEQEDDPSCCAATNSTQQTPAVTLLTQTSTKVIQ